MISEIEIRNNIANNLRRFRERLGKTQEELADIVHLTRTHIGNIERSELNITLKSLIRIAEAINVEPHILLMKNPPE